MVFKPWLWFVIGLANSLPVAPGATGQKLESSGREWWALRSHCTAQLSGLCVNLAKGDVVRSGLHNYLQTLNIIISFTNRKKILYYFLYTLFWKNKTRAKNQLPQAVASRDRGAMGLYQPCFQTHRPCVGKWGPRGVRTSPKSRWSQSGEATEHWLDNNEDICLHILIKYYAKRNISPW